MRSSRYLGALAFLCVFVLVGSPAMAKPQLPEWAADWADRFGELTQQDDETWSILLRSHDVKVLEDGRFDVTIRIAARAFEGRRVDRSVGWFPYRDGSKLRTADAWHLTPEGKTLKIRQPPVDVTTGGNALTDARVRHIPVTGVLAGSTLFFEFAFIETRPLMSWHHWFANLYPVQVSRFSVEAPSGFEIKHDWLRFDGAEPERAANRVSWELLNLPAPGEAESLGPDPLEAAPILAVSITTPHPVSETTTVANWSAFASWYEDVVSGLHEPDPSIDDATRAHEASADAFGSITFAGQAVRDDIRYVARLIGIGAYRPRPATQVFEEKLGDCKDKGTLLRSMLSTAGLESYPVLVNATSWDTVSDEVAAVHAFNHFIVAVPVPPDAEIPDRFRPATADIDGVGRLVLVDTTDDLNAIGSIPANLAGKTALLVAGDRSRLITIPGRDPASHREDQTLEIVFRDGALEVTESNRFLGEPARRQRSAMRSSEKGYRDQTAEILTRDWNGLELTALDLESETGRGEFTETLHYRVTHPGEILGFFPRASSVLPRVSLRKRAQPVVYDYPRTLSYATRLSLPAPIDLPQDETISGAGWSIAARFELDDETIVASWELRLERERFALDDQEELRDLWDAIRRTTSVAVRISEP